MKIGFYMKLAIGGIRRNKRMFKTYILTCTVMVTVFYIVMFLGSSSVIDRLAGGQTIREIFSMGSWVIAVFSAVFLFYTNSFLIRNRKKEFGIYNILGMGKRNIARILFWENLMAALITVVMGIGVGIALSKLTELGLVNIIHAEVTYDLSVSFIAIKRSLQIFGIIFALLFLNSIFQIHLSDTISLLKSENIGEKPPKGNWFIGILGILFLAAAYYISANIENPLYVLMTFLIAVIMVIIGTYCVMISGSVLFFRILQRNKNYYYKPNHFVSVSSLVYRMNRNGAGLASICILITFVLVIISFTTCLYIGEESAIKLRYPRDIELEFNFENMLDLSNKHIETIKNGVISELEKSCVEPEHEYDYRVSMFSGILNGNTVETDISDYGLIETSKMRLIYIVPLEDYNRLTGNNEILSDDEIFIYSKDEKCNSGTISFNNVCKFNIKKQIDEFIPDTGDKMMFSNMMIIVPDFKKTIEKLMPVVDSDGKGLIQTKWLFYFDTGTDSAHQISIYHNLYNAFTDSSVKKQLVYNTCYIDSRENDREDFYGLFGSIFYIGIIMSIVFIFAAVIVIYNKQISEGYEDRAGFEIMKKIGMTDREIKRSINSQLLTVFLFPLFLSALHIAFAFPIIQKLLLMAHLNNTILFAGTTVITILIFSVFYIIIYGLTSNTYYNIVSGDNKER